MELTKMYNPTREDWEALGENLADIYLLGDYRQWPAVEIKPVPNFIRQLSGMINRRDCYANTVRLIEHLHDEYDCRYVVGIVGGGPIPFSHCWLKLDGDYYDPTLEIAMHASPEELAKQNHHAVVELTFHQLILMLEKIDWEQYPNIAHFIDHPLQLPKRSDS